MFDRQSVLAVMFPGLQSSARKQARAALVARWSRARWQEPNLINDLVGMGNLLAMTPLQDGLPDIDPQRLAYEQGRRDLAIELLALMGAGPNEITNLMAEANHVSD